MTLEMNKFFLHTSRTFSNILPRWGPFCPDSSSFCPLSKSGQEKGCFWVGLGVFLVCTYPRKGFVTAGILGKMRPHLGKMRPLWANCTKRGQKCSRIGQKKFNHFNQAIESKLSSQVTRSVTSPL